MLTDTDQPDIEATFARFTSSRSAWSWALRARESKHRTGKVLWLGAGYPAVDDAPPRDYRMVLSDRSTTPARRSHTSRG